MEQKAAENPPAQSAPTPAAPTGPLVPMLRVPPASLDALIDRLKSLQYNIKSLADCQFQKDSGLNPPAVAFVPLGARTTVDQIKEAIGSYKELVKAAPTKYIAAYSGRIPLGVNELHVAGLDGIFQSPFEDELLINKFYELAPVTTGSRGLTIDQLLPVHLGEIEKMAEAPCDLFIYLPMNMKAILYVTKNSKPGEKVIKKFREHQRNFYIKRSDNALFQAYGSKYVAELQDGEVIGTAETSKKIASRLGGLMGDFFSNDGVDEDNAKQMVENLRSYVKDVPGSKNPQKALESAASELAAQKMTSSSHCQNTAAYSALFGLTLGLTNAENLRMGGILHDIGLMEVGPELAAKDMAAMKPEQQERYKKHIEAGQTVLANKKMSLPKEVMDMILFHHEHTDGSGFSAGLKAADIPPYAKVCAFANEFDKLTSIRAGYPQLTPKEAIKRIAGLDGKPPHPVYDPDFHKPLIAKFLGQPAEEKTTEGVGAVAAADAAEAKKKALLDSYSKKVSNPADPPVSIQRLLKTAEFAKPEFVPNVKSDNARIQEELSEIAENVRKHFAQAQK